MWPLNVASAIGAGVVTLPAALLRLAVNELLRDIPDWDSSLEPDWSGAVQAFARAWVPNIHRNPLSVWKVYYQSLFKGRRTRCLAGKLKKYQLSLQACKIYEKASDQPGYMCLAADFVWPDGSKTTFVSDVDRKTCSDTWSGLDA